jgi:hypothetical protein
MTHIRDFDPTQGQAFQGDILILPVPEKLAKTLSRLHEIPPREGRLILAEGEMTGHHHAIALPGFRSQPVMFRDDGLARDMSLAQGIPVGTATMYRDDALAAGMVREGPLTRSDLCVGFLVVEGAPMVVTHEEHVGIRLPVGVYLIGRQIESVGAEERRVAD